MTGRTHLWRAGASTCATFTLIFLSACGGGGDWTAASAPVTSIRYVLEYALPDSPVYPAGTITVSPPQGRATISDDGPVRVQLELAGFATQTLDAPNFEPKYNPQLKYVFGLPPALAPETRACTDAKVTVTSVSGEVSVASFGVCAGVGLGLEA